MSIYAVTFSNVEGSPVDLTPYVMSYSYKFGRESYLDNWNGNQLTIVIRNYNNQAALVNIDDKISCSILPGYFWVSSITFQDAVGTNATAGTGAGSTATIVCDDWLAKAGRLFVNDFTLTQTDTISQLTQFNTLLTANGMAIDTFYGLGSSQASASSYTGTVLNRVNLNMTTEKGQIKFYQNKAYFLPRSSIYVNSNSPVISSVNEGGTTIYYQAFERRTLGQNFVNTMTIQPDGLTEQTAAYAPSVSTYGTKSGTLSTVNATTAQALDFANWLAEVQADPMSLTFAIEVTDTGNTSDRFAAWLGFVHALGTWGCNLHYVVPGSGATTYVDVVLEGVNYQGFPDRNSLICYFSPKRFYDVFLLDSSTQGVLDVNRLSF